MYIGSGATINYLGEFIVKVYITFWHLRDETHCPQRYISTVTLNLFVCV